MSKLPLILLADDDADLVNAMRLRLEDYDFEVITARDGYNALSMAVDNQPDAMVLDINMPAGDGFSVQERLEHLKVLQNTAVIYMTGDKSQRLDQVAERFGAAAIFHKPFDVQDLADTLRKVLKPVAA